MTDAMVIRDIMASVEDLDTANFAIAWAGLVALCLLYAVMCDISVRIIPNRASLAIAALALPFRLQRHQLTESLAVAAVIFGLLLCLWSIRLIGGGDVKFWAACSLLIPPHVADQGKFSLHVILIGGLVALAYLALRIVIRLLPAHRAQPAAGRRSTWLARVWRAEHWRARRCGSIPYGVAIAASAWLAFWPSLPR